MQRQTVQQEEWTKYFVNGMECKREDLYQTILAKRFYEGEIRLERKFHHTEKHLPLFGFSGWSGVDTTNENREASFTLDTKTFAKKFGPNSEPFKALIDKMIYALDMFYAAQVDYDNNAENMRIAVRQCMSYLFENTSDTQLPYANINNEFKHAYLSLIFSLLANILCKVNVENFNGNLEIPSMDLSTPKLKEPYQDDWNNDKKSKHLEELLTTTRSKLKTVKHAWLSSKYYRDNAAHQQIETLFDQFKSALDTLHATKKSLDAELLAGSSSKLGKLLHRFHHHKPSPEQRDHNNDNNQPGNKM